MRASSVERRPKPVALGTVDRPRKVHLIHAVAEFRLVERRKKNRSTKITKIIPPIT